MAALGSAFSGVLDFLTSIGSCIIHFFTTLVSFFGFLTSSVSFLTSALSFIPVPLLVFAAAGIAISALFLVLGR